MSTDAEWRASNPSELGTALARLRMSRGLRQEDVADASGLRREYVSRLESGLATEQILNLFALLRSQGYELVLAPRSRNHG
jgi:transcriptional regulator with XRE-family HTH domain